MLMNSSCKDTRQKSVLRIVTNLSQHNEFTSAVRKWLNHEWKETFDVDPFDEITFPFIVPAGELILTSNGSLISINC